MRLATLSRRALIGRASPGFPMEPRNARSTRPRSRFFLRESSVEDSGRNARSRKVESRQGATSACNQSLARDALTGPPLRRARFDAHSRARRDVRHDIHLRRDAAVRPRRATGRAARGACHPRGSRSRSSRRSISGSPRARGVQRGQAHVRLGEEDAERPGPRVQGHEQDPGQAELHGRGPGAVAAGRPGGHAG